MNLYEQYTKNKFDLSVFGIERGENRSNYFCTPRGAKMIGWTGVDGIHYCTIKTLGKTVFAVEPMGYAGRHAIPIAENFEDFLRLLMACGHETYVEQTHAWSREQYDSFDFSTVPYKKDYYKYLPKDEMPQSKEWKMTFREKTVGDFEIQIN